MKLKLLLIGLIFSGGAHAAVLSSVAVSSQAAHEIMLTATAEGGSAPAVDAGALGAALAGSPADAGLNFAAGQDEFKLRLADGGSKVPELDVYAMLGLGAGMVGVIARRRNKVL